ncbi:hypothetical protein chiPu_0022252 [Chiloscyllium punctatum]|uniref:Uncharacterized protein n=1 Tax=Chiloscyllium punctatum TaxID=137246 RepID=A0A401RFZ2_CHIPU|nr:hypothetical protein [Chiloscyllium punctatum]
MHRCRRRPVWSAAVGPGRVRLRPPRALGAASGLETSARGATRPRLTSARRGGKPPPRFRAEWAGPGSCVLRHRAAAVGAPRRRGVSRAPLQLGR